VNFDFIAKGYEKMEKLVFGSHLQKTRLSLLPEVVQRLKPASSIVLIGDGDGRFFEELVKLQPDASYTYLEKSKRMLSLAQARIDSEVEWLHGGIELIEGREFDLIVTHFVLDCYSGEEVKNLITSVTKQVKPEGLWLISDFDGDAGWWARGLIFVMYQFFKRVARVYPQRLKSFDIYLELNHWQKVMERRMLKGLSYSQLWQQKN